MLLLYQQVPLPLTFAEGNFPMLYFDYKRKKLNAVTLNLNMGIVFVLSFQLVLCFPESRCLIVAANLIDLFKS